MSSLLARSRRQSLAARGHPEAPPQGIPLEDVTRGAFLQARPGRGRNGGVPVPLGAGELAWPMVLHHAWADPGRYQQNVRFFYQSLCVISC